MTATATTPGPLSRPDPGAVTVLRDASEIVLPVAIPQLEEAPLPAGVQKSVNDYQRSAHSENTLRAYRAALAVFGAWCDQHGRERLPASPKTVAGFLAEQADQGLAPTTLALRAAAIAFAHRHADLVNPCDAALVKRALRGVKRRRVAEGRGGRKQATPMTVERLAACLGVLELDTLIGKRDAAVLALGFAIAGRRSEIAALDLADLELDGAEGVLVTFRKSKTDQSGEGETLYVPAASNPQVCALRAVRAWLKAAQLTEGPLFRGVQGKRLLGRLSDRSVDLIVRRTAQRAEMEGNYSGHSLRSGLVTTLADRGRTEVEIMRQSRHKSSAMVKVYTRSVDAKSDCPIRGAW